MDDVVVVGGGIIGAATAYFLSKEGRKVKVIERDPAYKKASFPLSLGGFRRQFFQKENILLGKFAKEFIFKIPELLKQDPSLFVHISTDKKTYVYQIYKTKVIPKEELFLDLKSDTPEAVLVTCVPSLLYHSRLLVYSKLIGTY